MTFNGRYAIKKNKPNLIYTVHMYKKDLAFNDQRSTCHKKTKPNPIYLIYMYEKDLSINDFQWTICHETKQNQTLYI